MDDATRQELYLRFLRKGLTLSDINEPFLLDLIGRARSKYDVYGAILLLRHFGTEACLDVLKQCCVRPVADHQITAVFTLAKVGGPGEADFFDHLLQTKEFRQKWAAMACLCEFGEARHLASVLTRAKAAAKRTRACPEYGTLWGRETEITAALKFIDRHHLDGPKTLATLKKIAQGGVGLTESEKIALRDFFLARGIKATISSDKPITE